jgi:cysteine-rich repeat protein
MAACPSDAVEPATTVCRPPANTADAPESCDGTLKACPADLCTSAGTPCDDGDFCTQVDASNGVDGPGCQCVGADPVDCDDVNPCTDDTCDSQAGGFLCINDNNGTCIGPNCGNFQVDAGDGETCDPPNLTPHPVTGQLQCRLDCTSCGDGVVQPNDDEVCDDGNTISGCRTDQPQKPLDDCLHNCTEPICADPARISFGKGERPDLYYFHGRLIADEALDFAGKHFVIELRDNTGTPIYRSSLVSGSIEAVNEKAARYKNRVARDSGGVYQLKSKKGVGFYILSVKAYGDLSGAVADMSTHVYVGTDEWVVRGLWKQQGTKGWKLGKHDALLPVQ